MKNPFLEFNGDFGVFPTFTPLFEFIEDYSHPQVTLEFKKWDKVAIFCSPFTAPLATLSYPVYGQLDDEMHESKYLKNVTLENAVANHLFKSVKFIGFVILDENCPRWLDKKWTW